MNGTNNNESTDTKNDFPTFINSIGQEFVLIQPGEFVMGSPETEEGHNDNETQRIEQIKDAFYLQTTQVTQRQWEAVMENLPSQNSTHAEGETASR